MRWLERPLSRVKGTPALSLGIAIGILIVAWLTSALYALKLKSDIRAVGEGFINAIARGDLRTASVYACGNVSWRLAQVKNLGGSEPVVIKSVVDSFSPGWAQVTVEAQVRLADGTYDVGWYQVDLVRKKDWQVYHVEQAGPAFTAGWWGGNNIEGLEETFRAFLNRVATNKDPVRYLAGPARTAYERQKQFSVLPKVKFEDMRSRPLKVNKSLAVVQFNYGTGNRHVAVVVTGVKTIEGWKVVDIKPCNKPRSQKEAVLWTAESL